MRGKFDGKRSQFHQPFGSERKSTSAQYLAQKMLFSFTNIVAYNSTCAQYKKSCKDQCKTAHKMMVKLTPSGIKKENQKKYISEKSY